MRTVLGLAAITVALLPMACVHQPQQGTLQASVDTVGLPEPPQPVTTAQAPVAAQHASAEAPASHTALPKTTPADAHAAPTGPSAAEARQRLTTGNRVFADDATFAARRAELKTGQHPFAVVLTCADSRVPPEQIFSQQLGDLFVIRVAGNVVDPDVLGSIEYAVEHMHAPLVIVMGHESCGAVKAAVEGGEAPGSIGALVEKIEPAVKQARSIHPSSPQACLNSAIDFNVLRSLAQIRRSEIVQEAIAHHGLRVMGARYQLATGTVAWFDSAKK